MRRTRAFFCLAALTVLAACGADLLTPVFPSDRPLLDGGGYMGTGNGAGTASVPTSSDSVAARGTGYMGSGN
jgi:hypothetical protein